MKKVVIILVALLMLAACADKKAFVGKDGKPFIAKPYGWANYETNKTPGVKYSVNAGNIVWDVLASETMIVPVLLTGWQLFEPVDYEPNNNYGKD